MYALPQPASTTRIRSRSHNGSGPQQLDVVLHLPFLVVGDPALPRRADGPPAAGGWARGRASRWRHRSTMGAVRDEPLAFLRAAGVHVAVSGEQVHVAGIREQRSRRVGHSPRSTVSVRGPSTSLTAGPRLQRRPASPPRRPRRACASRRRVRAPGAPPWMKLRPAAATDLSSGSSSSGAAGAGTTRSRSARPRLPARASARRARRRRGLPATRAPWAPWNGRTQTTRPFATKKARRAAVVLARHDDADGERPEPSSIRAISRETSSSASIRSRRRAASSKRSSPASRRSFRRSLGSASSSVSQSTPCSARTASCAVRLLFDRAERPRRRRADDRVAAPAQIDVSVGARRARVRGGRSSRISRSSSSAASNSEPSTRHSIRCSAPRAPSTAGRCRSERKYERRRARRSRALPT